MKEGKDKFCEMTQTFVSVAAGARRNIVKNERNDSYWIPKSVCRMSKSEGYSFIEVYPHEGAMICTDFDSAMQLYRANGFKSLSKKNGEAVLRKEL